MPENRRFSRIPFQVRAELTIDANRYMVNELINLGIGGCLLPISVDLPQGGDCTLKVYLEGTSDDLHLTIEGKIIRTTDEGTAVQFTRIDPQSLFHLQNIIRFNAPDADAIDDEIQKHPGLK